ncbi:MAG: primosomal protein N' [Desulfovibrio sp.]|nr:primosomal protein N' [Desulfovibrio sp.]
MFAKIALLFPPYSVLTYALPDAFPPEFWRKGTRVCVPLGKQIRSGYIVSADQRSDLPSGTVIKSVVWPLEKEPVLNEELADLARDLAARQGAELGSVFGHVLPAELKSGDFRLFWRGAIYDPGRVGIMNADSYREMALAFARGEATFAEKRRRASENDIIRLKIDPPWPLRPAAKKQIALLDFIHEKGWVTREQISQKFGPGCNALLKKALEAGYVDFQEDKEKEAFRGLDADFKLSGEQEKAAREFGAALASDRPECRLLYGVTGSGKTAVYLRLVRECLARGKSALLLAPEAALAHKLYADAASVIPAEDLYLYHGYQTSRSRSDLFAALASSREPKLVVGTRSALFLPLHNPGCVILDEEHDSSFKQDEGFVYHAKEVAWFRMQKNSGLLILGSATPDIKTFYAAKIGAIPRTDLKSRVSGASLPPVELTNIGALSGKAAAGTIKATAEGLSLLSPYCEEALRECARKGEQAVILLNRRGYAPMIYCLNCAKILRCPHCEIGLSYHKSAKKLICHYCGYTAPYPSPCPDCRRANFLAVGEGTEKIAERLETIAGREILRLDRDNTRRPGKIDEILNDFRANRSPFLVGTQMLSKGHHFPNVTLAVVADGDIGLNMPDYRATERAFQLLIQAGGRAGRGEKPGRVLIQTRNVNHYCWKYVLNSDYEGFYKEELARREKKLYPPFVKLALLRFSFPQNDARAADSITELRPWIRREGERAGAIVLGPAPSPLAMLRGMRRFQCVIKSGEWQNIRELYFKLLKQPFAGRLKIFLDLDPVNML